MGDANRDVQTTDQWLDSTLDQVFLSPRVIDERAYEELSGSLRTLMKDAAGQSRALIATTGEVKLLGDQLREATQQLQAKVETAVRVIPTLDQRMKQAEALLEVTGKDLASKVTAIQEAATRAVPLERERITAQLRAEAAAAVDEIVREHLPQLRRLIDTEVAAVEREVEARVQRLLEPVQRASDSLAAAVQGFEERSARIHTQLAADEARIAELSGALEGVIARANGQSGSLAGLETRLAEACTRAEAVQSSIESTVTEAGVRLGAGLSQAERKAGELSERLAGELDSVNAALGALHVEVEAARGLRPAAGPALSPATDARELEELGQWLQQLITQGDRIGRGLAALIQRAQP
ncbi:MAG TPA: hypothetical protein VD997_14515 [Phycisphaerales bacterium]|nr:hypothetical protein [Phycisphaerales bacterium]